MNNKILQEFRNIVMNNGKVISARLNEKYFTNIDKLSLWNDWNELTKNLKNQYKSISEIMIASEVSLELSLCSHCMIKPRIIVNDEKNNYKRVLSKWCSIKCSSKSDEKVSKFKEAILARSDEDWTITKERKAETMLEKYGYAYNLQRPEVRANCTANSQLNAYGELICEKINDTEWLYSQYWVEGKSALKISNELNIDSTSFRNILKNKNIVKEFNRTYWSHKSNPEIEIYEFIKLYKPSAINSYRLKPTSKELDVFIPELNIGFEYNGGYHHNESRMEKEYHKNKMDYWNNLGIRVVQIWSDDWENKKDLIKTMILYRLGVVKKKIHARKCKVAEVSTKDYRLFLNNNHILGADNPSIRLGLYNGGELVSVMGLKKIPKNVKKRVGMDLTRFSTLQVHGSFSKLLMHFRKTNNFTINSIADLEIVDRYNNVYLKNGFVEDFVYELEYSYYNNKTKLITHKFSYRKIKFKSRGYNIEGKTEKMLAKDSELLKCWDSGKVNYILHPA
jgi:hypothetical protein